MRVRRFYLAYELGFTHQLKAVLFNSAQFLALAYRFQGSRIAAIANDQHSVPL